VNHTHVHRAIKGDTVDIDAEYAMETHSAWPLNTEMIPFSNTSMMKFTLTPEQNWPQAHSEKELLPDGFRSPKLRLIRGCTPWEIPMKMAVVITTR
jgi:hypothetical protein